MEFRVRVAHAGDAEAIARVQVQSWRSTYTGIVPAAYLRALDVLERTKGWIKVIEGGQAAMFVAESAGEVFGFCCGGGLRDAQLGGTEGYDGELYAIYVLAARQGSGAGRRLTERLEGALRGQGVQRILTWVLKDNPAVGFYRRVGAVWVAEKTIEIGGEMLVEVAYGWPIRNATNVAE